jgi:hypothetical protein
MVQRSRSDCGSDSGDLERWGAVRAEWIEPKKKGTLAREEVSAQAPA